MFSRVSSVRPTPLPAFLRVLSDPVRLRTLALLELEELSVGELARALGLTQSRVSNHLRVLREAGLLRERHAGKTTYLRCALSQQPASEFAARLWTSLRDELAALPEHEADRRRLSDLVAERRARGAEFFDVLAGEWDKVGAQFRSGVARERAAASLLPPGLVLADLGCGTGYMARALLGRAERLICVDRSAGMLEEAERRLGRTEGRVEYRRGELDALPIADGELDGAVMGMVLHHLEDLDRPLFEVRRALKPGGALAVVELAPHRESWMHEALGDRRLGLDPSDVLAALRRNGFQDLRIEDVDDGYCPRSPIDGHSAELSLYIVRGRVPGGRHA